MIGIAIITHNRPQHLKLCYEQIHKHIPQLFRFFISDDTDEKKGVAYRTNECLKALKDCDYIFIFNDDCFPIKTGWTDFFIDAHKASGQHHFLYLKDTTSIKKMEAYPTFVCQINSYNNCGGCFIFLTKEVIEKVGGFCKEYGRYGYEHAGFSNRIHQAGLTPMGMYLCPEGASDYIYAMDYDYYLPFNKQVNHSPSISVREAIASIKYNEPIFKKDIQTVFQPL